MVYCKILFFEFKNNFIIEKRFLYRYDTVTYHLYASALLKQRSHPRRYLVDTYGEKKGKEFKLRGHISFVSILPVKRYDSFPGREIFPEAKISNERWKPIVFQKRKFVIDIRETFCSLSYIGIRESCINSFLDLLRVHFASKYILYMKMYQVII